MATYGNDDRPVQTGAASGGTAAGHDVTSRMAGTHDEQHVRTVRPSDDRRDLGDDRRGLGVDHAKTSAAAAFALVFGVAALFSALTAILSPAAVLLGLIGIVLGIVGLQMAKRPGVTGKGVAIGGLVTAVLGLLIGGAVIAGASVLVNDEQRLDQLQNQVEDMRNDLPSTAELREDLPS